MLNKIDIFCHNNRCNIINKNINKYQAKVLKKDCFYQIIKRKFFELVYFLNFAF